MQALKVLLANHPMVTEKYDLLALDIQKTSPRSKLSSRMLKSLLLPMCHYGACTW